MRTWTINPDAVVLTSDAVALMTKVTNASAVNRKVKDNIQKQMKIFHHLKVSFLDEF